MQYRLLFQAGQVPEHFAEAITEGHASAVLAASVFHWTIYHR